MFSFAELLGALRAGQELRPAGALGLAVETVGELRSLTVHPHRDVQYLVEVTLLQAKRVRGLWIYLPLALAAWYLTEISGVHATVAGVALGLMTRVHSGPGEENSPADPPAGVGLDASAAHFSSSLDAPAPGADFDDPQSLGDSLGNDSG